MNLFTQHKQLIKDVFRDIFENIDFDEKIIENYFSKNYIQRVNGEILDYSEFVSHAKTLKSTLKSVKITFKQMIAEDDKVATIHIAECVKKDNSTATFQVNAVFGIQANKIISCDELTFLMNGSEKDKDLGSRH